MPPRPVPARPVRCVVESLESRRHLSTTVTITTDHAQTIDGFGTSLGGPMDDATLKSTKFIKAYYQDFGSSVLRLHFNPWPLKGTTANGKKSIGVAVHLGPNVKDNAKLFDFTGYTLQKWGRWARAAKTYGSEVKLIASMWSPPYWMKGEEVSPMTGRPTGVMPTFDDTHGDTSGGSLIDTEDNLTQFGRYVAAYVYGFRQAFGVTLDALSLQNELAFHEPYSSAVYTPDLYVKAVKAADRWLRKAGLDTQLIGPEDVGVGGTDNVDILNRQMAYIKAIRRDPDARRAIATYAIHGYANDGNRDQQRSPTMWDRYWTGNDGPSDYDTFAGIKADQKKSYVTETSGYWKSWNSAMRLAGNVQDALVHGNVSAFVYWGIANRYDTTESLMTGADYSDPRYNVFKHFTKYVRPGATRLQTSDTDPDGVYVSAFADDQAKTLTGVIVNGSDEDQDVTLKLDGITLKRFGTVTASTEKNPWKTLTNVRVKGNKATLTVAARSVLSLVGSTADATPTGGISGTYFRDTDRDGRLDATEKGLVGDKVFLDLNADGTRDRREPVAVTGRGGGFAFTGLPAGTYRVRRALDPDSGWTVTTAATATRLKKDEMDAVGVMIGVAPAR